MGRSGAAAVPRDDARKALQKAEQFLASAQDDLKQSRWTAAGLSAVHAGISAGDAALIASAGIRSTSQDHGVALELLEDNVSDFGVTQRRQLGGLIKMKNTVAYEQRLLAPDEAKQLVDQASRLTRWAGAVVSRMLD